MPSPALLASRSTTGSLTPFTPDLVSGLQGWWKSDTLSALADNDPVSTWADSSGNSRDMTQALTARPTLKEAIQNGRDVVRFDGTNDHLATANTTLNLTADLTFFAVIPAASASKALFSKDNGNGNASEVTFFTDGSGKLTMDRAWVEAGVASTTAITAWATVICIVSGTSVSHYLNGAANGTDTITTGNAVTTPLRIGSFEGLNTTFGFWNTDVGEIGIYNAALSAGDRASLQTYLKGRWGTP